MADFDPTLFGGSISDTAVGPDYASIFASAEKDNNLQPGLLSAIAKQENVASRHNNPLGLSSDSGVKTFSSSEAEGAIRKQAALISNPSGPYRDFARTGNVDDLAKVYSPIGAKNDIHGTNATEASGIRSNLGSDSGFDPAIFGGSTPQTAPRATAAGAPISSGFDPNQFDVPESSSATQTPPEDKDSLAGRVGSAIAQGGAAYAKSQQPVQPANFQYTPPQPPAAGGNQVQPIENNFLKKAFAVGAAATAPTQRNVEGAGFSPGGKISPQDWANLLYRASLKIATPTNLQVQDAFDSTYNALPQKAKNALNTPLVDSGAARGLIQTGAQLAGVGAPELLRFVESTRMGQGLMDTAANTLSSATTGASALSMPAFFIPGVAETWAARQAKDTPKAWGQVQQAVQQNGIFSREGAAALSQEMVRLGTIGLAAKGGAGLRASLAEKVGGAPKRPYSKPPISPTVPPPLPVSALDTPRITAAAIQDSGTGKTFTGPSHPQIYDKFPQIKGDPGEAFTGEGWNTGGDYVDGFVDQHGKFYDREQAAELAGLSGEASMGELESVSGNISRNAGYEIQNPTVSAIANKYQPETAGLGQGSSPAAAIARGSQFTPEQINQHLSDLNQGIGDIQAQTAAVRVESARLQARSEAAGKALQANPRSIELRKAADDAFKDWADFQHGPQAKLKATWARMGHELQGSVPVDLSSVNGLRQKFFNEMGREATPTETKVLGRYADKVERTEKARVSELNKVLDEIAKRSKDVDASPDAMAKMRENIANRMGKKFPCRN